ncbi:Arf GTPase activating protein [Trypanosoma melophagium]|uniref:Arf GTPase activating protein n=1 Tax=Trypanosoma melophagium TaxID=715481 RepID=UPI00351A5B0B|nr:Arf GTPase activating protein [Trypanosoma melophagium]
MNLHARKLERNREEVRKLSLKDGNRFCMDCGMRGPLYVVTNFRIFVCSTCAALHRSLQHKVKGISMTEFTDEEVMGLRIAGNDRATRIWLHNYKRNRPPGGNVAAVKDFIINVFDDKVYMDREEFNKFQNELKKAMSNDSGLPPRTTLPPQDPAPQRRSVSLHEQPTPQPPQVAETQTQTQRPSESQTLKNQDVHSVKGSQIDFFTQSVPQQEPQNSSTLNTSNDSANDDLFGDFCTAAAPPASSTTTVPSAHETVADWFASAPPVQVANNVMYQAASGITGMYAMPSAPQMYPPGMNQYPTMMPSQPGMQNCMGVNQGGFGPMPGVVYPNQPPQQQQQQYPYQQQSVHPMAVPTAPYVFNKVLGVHDQQSRVGGVAPPVTSNTDFFQATPTGLWENSNAATQPMKTDIKREGGEQDSNVFASLNPFGSTQ